MALTGLWGRQSIVADTTYKACCLCDNVKYVFGTRIPSRRWPIPVCDYLFYSGRAGHLLFSDPRENVRLEFADLDMVYGY